MTPAEIAVAGEAGGVMNVELVHEVLPVLFDGLDADAECGCDLFVGRTLGHQYWSTSDSREVSDGWRWP